MAKNAKVIWFGWHESCWRMLLLPNGAFRGHSVDYDEVRQFLTEPDLRVFANPAETGMITVVRQLFGVSFTENQLQRPDLPLSPDDDLIASYVSNGALYFYRYTFEENASD
jgi:hypothetical protein